MSGVTVVRFADQKVPKQYLDTCLLKHSSSLGCAFNIPNPPDGSKPHLALINRSLKLIKDWDAAVEGLQSKDLLGRDVVMRFSTLSEGFEATDIQPFPVLWNDQNKISCAAFLEGVENPKEEIQVIRPLLQGLLAKHKGDLEALIADLRENKAVQRSLANLWEGDQGCITFLFAGEKSGTQLFFGNPKDKEEGGPVKDFDWGWTTDPFDYVEGTAEATAPKEEEASPLDPAMQAALAALGEGGEEAKPEVKPEVQPKKEEAPVKAEPPKVDPKQTKQGKPVIASVEPLNKASPDAPDMEFWTPPVGMRKNDLVKEILKHNHTTPKNFWELYQKGELKILRQKRKTAKDFRDLKGTLVPAQQSEQPKIVEKDTDTKHIPPQKPEKTPELPAGMLTVEERTAVKPIVDGITKGRKAAYQDQDGKITLDPEHVPDMTKLGPDWAKQVGLPSMYATAGYTEEDLIKIGTDCGVATLAKLALWWKHSWLAAESKKPEIKPDTQQSTTTERVHPRVLAAQKKAANG